MDKRIECDEASVSSGPPLGTVDLLRQETNAWHQYINDKQRGVDWQFRIDDARTKLKSLYPKIKV